MSDELCPYPADEATAGVFRALAQLVYATDDFAEVYDAIVQRRAPAGDRLRPRQPDAAQRRPVRDRRRERRRRPTVDGFERELGEGPCLDAIVDESVYHDADLTDGSPWPRLTERVLATTPVRGMAGFRLLAGEQKTGRPQPVLRHRRRPDRRGRSTRASCWRRSSPWRCSPPHERKAAETLRAGLASNREIGKAIGLMMAFHKITDDEAFEMLRKASQDMNIKLAEVARQVVEHHNQV